MNAEWIDFFLKMCHLKKYDVLNIIMKCEEIWSICMHGGAKFTDALKK